MGFHQVVGALVQTRAFGVGAAAHNYGMADAHSAQGDEAAVPTMLSTHGAYVPEPMPGTSKLAQDTANPALQSTYDEGTKVANICKHTDRPSPQQLLEVRRSPMPQPMPVPVPEPEPEPEPVRARARVLAVGPGVCAAGAGARLCPLSRPGMAQLKRRAVRRDTSRR